MISKKNLIILFVSTVSLRFLCSWLVKGFEPMLWEYEYLTQNLINEGEYSLSYREYGDYKALLAPGYSMLTYAVYSIFGTSHILMLFIQYLLMFGGACIVYLISTELFGNKRFALASSVMMSIHPGLIHYGSDMLHQLNLYLPLFYTTIYFLILSYKYEKTKFFVLAGFFGGLGMLSRATIMPIIGLSFIMLLLLKRKQFKELFPKVIFAGVVLLIVYSPWVIRNYMVFDKFIFAQTNKWESFWIGNNAEATGGHYKTDGTLVLNSKPDEMQKEINESNSELLDNKIFKKYAMDFVKENPGIFVKGLFRKAFYYWWYAPHTGILYPKKVVLLAKVAYMFFMLLVFYGFYYCYKEKLFNKTFVFPGVFIFGIFSAHTVYFLEMRHRWTVEPILMLVAAIPIVLLWEKYISKTTNSFSEEES